MFAKSNVVAKALIALVVVSLFVTACGPKLAVVKADVKATFTVKPDGGWTIDRSGTDPLVDPARVSVQVIRPSFTHDTDSDNGQIGSYNIVDSGDQISGVFYTPFDFHGDVKAVNLLVDEEVCQAAAWKDGEWANNEVSFDLSCSTKVSIPVE